MSSTTNSLATNFETNLNSNDEVYECTSQDGKFIKYDIRRLHFQNVAEEKVPTANPNGPPMVNYRMSIQDKRADGRLQDLLIRFDAFTYGVSESVNQVTNELNGYKLPMPMWDQEGATPIQKYLTDLLEVEILGAIKEQLVAVGASFGQSDLDIRDLRKMKIFYRPKGADISAKPTLYANLIASKNKGMKIITRFYLMDENGNTCIDNSGNPIELDPLLLMKRMGKVKVVIKIESVYISQAGFSVQLKVWEADYHPIESALPRKATVNRVNATVVSTDDSNPLYALMLGNKSRIETSREEGGDIVPTTSSDSAPSSTSSAISTLPSSSTSSASDSVVVRRTVKPPTVKKLVTSAD